MLTKLQAALAAGEFTITAELVPPLAADQASVLNAVEPLAGRVHAINVTDGAGARTSVSSFAVSAILAAHDYEPVSQLTCRDRNRIAITSDLLGASAQNVHNVLVLTGDDPKDGDQPEAKPVFDYDSRGVIQLARDMRDKGELPSGRAIEPPPHFFIGAADVPQQPGPKWNSDSLLKKADAGAQFLQTQFCFDLKLAQLYIGRLHDEGLTERLAFLLGVGPIASVRSARWMNANLWGVNIPESVIGRLEGAADPKAEGRRICAELIAGFREIQGVAGVHIMAPAQSTAAIAETLDVLNTGTAA